MAEPYGTAAYWRERHGKLRADYLDMQRILAAIVSQSGGEVTVRPWTLAELPAQTWIYAMKTTDGGMKIAVMKEPGEPDKAGTDRERARSVRGTQSGADFTL